jgi:acetolactate synthase small subunit
MKQTAVEWFYDELKKLIKEFKLTDMKPSAFDAREIKLIEQAKEMEKQQIIDFAVWFNNRDNSYKSYTEIVEQYYNETFNK